MKAKLLVLAAFVGAVTLAAADNNKLAPELQAQNGAQSVDVIVRYNVIPGTTHVDNIVSHHGQVTKDLSSLKDLAATLPASQLDDLSNDADIAYITPDRKVAAFFLDTPAPAINAQYAWNEKLDGSNIAVAVIDSGMRGSVLLPFMELTTWDTANSRILYSQSWISDGWGTADHFGHGTHVAGIIGGNGAGLKGEETGKNRGNDRRGWEARPA